MSNDATTTKSKPTHELEKFLRDATVELASEYQRIHARASEDPGTAGDEGEENWAELLRSWLPPYYQVVTKGRILGYRGKASPQIDVLVLSPAYPRHLIHKKLYLADGVVAAFECKLTLRPGHIQETFKKSVAIRALYDECQGTPYRELHSPLIYGLLAHSCHRRVGWEKGFDAYRYLQEIGKGAAEITHPREGLDLVCIADLATFPSMKSIQSLPKEDSLKSVLLNYHQLLRRDAWPDVLQGRDLLDYDPVGTALYDLLTRLAWRDVMLRPIAEYFRAVVYRGGGISPVRMWPLEILSENVRRNLPAEDEKRDMWDEWEPIY